MMKPPPRWLTDLLVKFNDEEVSTVRAATLWLTLALLVLLIPVAFLVLKGIFVVMSFDGASLTPLDRVMLLGTMGFAASFILVFKRLNLRLFGLTEIIFAVASGYHLFGSFSDGATVANSLVAMGVVFVLTQGFENLQKAPASKEATE